MQDGRAALHRAFCTTCGAPLAPSHNFCGRCGQQVCAGEVDFGRSAGGVHVPHRGVLSAKDRASTPNLSGTPPLQTPSNRDRSSLQRCSGHTCKRGHCRTRPRSATATPDSSSPVVLTTCTRGHGPAWVRATPVDAAAFIHTSVLPVQAIDSSTPPQPAVLVSGGQCNPAAVHGANLHPYSPQMMHHDAGAGSLCESENARRRHFSSELSQVDQPRRIPPPLRTLPPTPPPAESIQIPMDIRTHAHAHIAGRHHEPFRFQADANASAKLAVSQHKCQTTDGVPRVTELRAAHSRPVHALNGDEIKMEESGAEEDGSCRRRLAGRHALGQDEHSLTGRPTLLLCQPEVSVKESVSVEAPPRGVGAMSFTERQLPNGAGPIRVTNAMQRRERKLRRELLTRFPERYQYMSRVTGREACVMINSQQLKADVETVQDAIRNRLLALVKDRQRNAASARSPGGQTTHAAHQHESKRRLGQKPSVCHSPVSLEHAQDVTRLGVNDFTETKNRSQASTPTLPATTAQTVHQPEESTFSVANGCHPMTSLAYNGTRTVVIKTEPKSPSSSSDYVTTMAARPTATDRMKHEPEKSVAH